MPKTVVVGRRYETIAAPWLVWEVVEIHKLPVLGAHAVLRRVDDPATTKTVSLAALEQHASYRLLPE